VNTAVINCLVGVCRQQNVNGAVFSCHPVHTHAQAIVHGASCA